MMIFAYISKEALPKRRISANIVSIEFVEELSILTMLERVHL